MDDNRGVGRQGSVKVALNSDLRSPPLSSFLASPRRRPSLPRPLSPQGREGRKTEESFFFIPSSPLGRGGVGEVRAGGAATLKLKTTTGSELGRPYRNSRSKPWFRLSCRGWSGVPK